MLFVMFYIVKARANGFNICYICLILLKDVECWGWQTVSTYHQHFDSTKLHMKLGGIKMLIHERPGIQSQALGFSH